MGWGDGNICSNVNNKNKIKLKKSNVWPGCISMNGNLPQREKGKVVTGRSNSISDGPSIKVWYIHGKDNTFSVTEYCERWVGQSCEKRCEPRVGAETDSVRAQCLEPWRLVKRQKAHFLA